MRHAASMALVCGIMLAGLLVPALAQDVKEDEHDHAHEAATVAEEPEHHESDELDDPVDHEGADEDGHDHEAEMADDDSGIGEEQDHEEDGAVELTPEAIRMAGIRLARVSPGRIGTSIHVPGEVGFDEDRLAHVVPRFAGIAKEARHRVGDHVSPGDVLAVVESNESMSTYAIKAPISGWIIERHVTPGEFVSGENSIYVIADLSRVWVNLAVYPKDADKIAPGQTVMLHAIGSDIRTEGTVEYLAPVLDTRTRCMTARIVLPNPDNTWRPGMFVHADVVASRGEERLLVEKDAVQILDDEHVVFVPEGDVHFMPVHVIVGESDSRYVEIIAGLELGTEYVVAGAFELKAKIVTSALGDHAGHGH